MSNTTIKVAVPVAGPGFAPLISFEDFLVEQAERDYATAIRVADGINAFREARLLREKRVSNPFFGL